MHKLVFFPYVAYNSYTVYGMFGDSFQKMGFNLKP